MKYKKTLKRGLAGVVVGGMLLSGGMAFADDTGSTKEQTSIGEHFAGKMMQGKKGIFQGKRLYIGDRREELQAVLEQMVKQGTIDQGKADEITAFIEKTDAERQAQFEEIKKLTPEERKALWEERKKDDSAVRPTVRQDLFTQLVENKIITQEQVDAIRTAMKEAVVAKQHQDMQDGLKAIVEKGAITQKQADMVVNRFDEIRKNHEALFEKTKDMTPEERREYLIDNKEKINPLNQLVTDGVITQEQADAIKEILPRGKGYRGSM